MVAVMHNDGAVHDFVSSVSSRGDDAKICDEPDDPVTSSSSSHQAAPASNDGMDVDKNVGDQGSGRVACLWHFEQSLVSATREHVCIQLFETVEHTCILF